MVPYDAILLGITVVGFLVAVPVGIALVLLMLWGTRPKAAGRRSS